MSNVPKLSARFVYSGDSSSFGGHGCADDADHSEYLLYASYGRDTALHDIIDQLVDDACDVPECCTDDAVREALLDMLSDAGRADYESGELSECSAEFAADTDLDEYEDDYESPVYIVLLDYSKPSRRTDGAILVGRKGQEYWFISSVFEHGTGLQGCTGMTVYPVSESYADHLLEPENMEDRYGEHWESQYKNFIKSDCRKCRFGVDEEGCEHCGYPSLRSFCGDLSDFYGIESMLNYAGDEFVAAMVEKGADAEYGDSSSCGRIFGHEGADDFDEVYNRKALVACLAYEDGAVDYDYAVKVIYG